MIIGLTLTAIVWAIGLNIVHKLAYKKGWNECGRTLLDSPRVRLAIIEDKIHSGLIDPNTIPEPIKAAIAQDRALIQSVPIQNTKNI